ncbi:MAG: hypothetical protein MUE99_04305 [Chitinophagaceae bacterium]|nr:hypothetical protein [Chitinophagaceae bacterium]
MKKMLGYRLKITDFIWFVLFSLNTIGQNTIGIPDITNYPHEAMNAGTQTWEIGQDSLGILYFANNSGLLTYNGKDWKLHALPNKTVTRSLAVMPDGKIMIGGQDALGYFFPDNNGNLQFHSLLNKLPVESRNFGDIWNIVVIRDEVFFRATKFIYQYSYRKGTLKVHNAQEGSSWTFMGRFQNDLFAQNSRMGLVKLTLSGWKIVSNDAPIKNTLMTDIQPLGNDSALISTLRNGIFLITPNGVRPYDWDSRPVKDQVYTMLALGKQSFAVGTVSNGIYMMDRYGKIIRHFSGNNGLQNNNVRCLFVDRGGNLWAGLDEGIVVIKINSSVHRILPVSQTRIATYASLVDNNRLFIGTSDGLYYSKLDSDILDGDLSRSTGSFERIEGSDGQVWSLKKIYGDIWMGHHDGAFRIRNNRAEYLTRYGGGTWLFKTIPHHKNLFNATYSGIQRLLIDRPQITADSSFENKLQEPLRFVEIDSAQNTIWASHPYRGIYRIYMSENFQKTINVKLYTVENGLPGNINNYVFRLNGKIIFATEKGIYAFDPAEEIFKKDEVYAKVFRNESIRFATVDAKKRIWFASENKIGVVEKGDVRFFPEFEGMLVGGFENIYPMNDQNIFIGSSNGIIHLNYEKYSLQKNTISVIFNKVVANNGKDSLIFNGYFVENGKVSSRQPAELIKKLHPSFSSFHFNFSCNQYGSSPKIMYRYKLEGFDKNWSEWLEKSDKDYTNLPYGSYSFMVQARDYLGNTSGVYTYKFQIEPRWYQTLYAKAVYFILGILMILLAVHFHHRRMNRQRKKFEKEEQQMKYLHELEIEHNEREIIKLRNERLETEVLYKNRELAAMTMHLYKRGRILSKIREELDVATHKLSINSDRTNFIKLLKMISDEEKREGDWEKFSVYFDEVHNSFLQKLKGRYENLSPTDLKMSAYIKMNLSAKEIAQLMNITIKGVEIARYRLKKKLDVPPDQNLNSFINNFN